MGEVATLQVFLYNLGNNSPPESILPFIPLIVDLLKLLQVLSDALIEWPFLRGVGAVLYKI